MGLGFVQVDSGFLDGEACGRLALELDVDREIAGAKMLRVWSWGLEQAWRAPADAPIRGGVVAGKHAQHLVEEAARWTGPRGEFVRACIAAGLIERLDGAGGLRFKGWEQRYGAGLRKQVRDNAKPDGRKSRPNQERDSGGIREGFAGVDQDQDKEVDQDQEDDRSIDRSSGSAPSGSSQELAQAWNAETKAPLLRWEQHPPPDKLVDLALARRPVEGDRGWRAVFRRLHGLPYCRGEVNGAPVATPRWVLKPAGKKPEPAEQILSGAYDPLGPGPPKKRGRATDADKDWSKPQRLTADGELEL